MLQVNVGLYFDDLRSAVLSKYKKSPTIEVLMVELAKEYPLGGNFHNEIDESVDTSANSVTNVIIGMDSVIHITSIPNRDISLDNFNFFQYVDGVKCLRETFTNSAKRTYFSFKEMTRYQFVEELKLYQRIKPHYIINNVIYPFELHVKNKVTIKEFDHINEELNKYRRYRIELSDGYLYLSEGMSIIFIGKDKDNW